MKNLSIIFVLSLLTVSVFGQQPIQSIELASLSLDPLDYELTIPGESVQRTPLFEVFTSSTCPPCKQGNINLHNALDESDGNWTCVKYQMYWPGDGDPYFTEEGYSRSRLFDISAVPALLLDGNTTSLSTLDGDVIQEKQEVESFVELVATYVQEDKQFDINVSVLPKQNFLTPFINLYVAIVENQTTKNKKSNGENKFEFVMKKMLPASTGTSVKPLKTDVEQSFEFSFEFQGNYRLPVDASDPINHESEHSVEGFDDLSVVVWVQNKITGEVLQSTWATTTSSTNEAISSGNGIIALFPNPVQEEVNLHYLVKMPAVTQIDLFDMTGNRIKTFDQGKKPFGNHFETINVSDLEEGAYILRLQFGKETHTRIFFKSK